MADPSPDITLVPLEAHAVHGPLETARELLRDYAQGLGIDLAFQEFEAELASLPGAFAPPSGRLLLAFVDGAPAGCIALRAIVAAGHAEACEMKRLFVRPAFRGSGLGRRLADALLDEARRAGYATMLLDTLDDMTSARALYARLGFVETAPYCFNPLPGARYLKVDLKADL